MSNISSFLIGVATLLIFTNNAACLPRKIKRSSSTALPEPGACGSQLTQDRIFGGNATALDEFPWMVLLEYKEADKYILGCGGSIINSRFILTAAHCIKNILKRVRLGEYDTRTEEDCMKYYDVEDCTKAVSMDIETVISHPGFNAEGKNDIALLKTKETIVFGDFIKPICLPLKDKQLPNEFQVAGWGQTETGEESSLKLKVKVPLYERSKCVTHYKRMIPSLDVDSTQVCAGGQTGKDSCVGDSGGPLMAPITKGTKESWYQYGVVSLGAYPCGTVSPAIYTDVSYYLPWILEQIKK